MARGRFIPPKLNKLPAGSEMCGPREPSLTPETFDPLLATEELERAVTDPAAFVELREVKELEELLKLELEGDN